MFSLFKLPFFRHLIAAFFILSIGFYFGNTLFQKKLSKVKAQALTIKGKYTQLNENYHLLKQRTNTLQKVVIQLAEKEHIKVENHIKDTKNKKGARLNLIPNTTTISQHKKILAKKKY